MNEDLAAAILAASRELAETIEAGEHPGAALRSVRTAYSRCTQALSFGRAEQSWHLRLSAVLGVCQTAVQVYGYDPERVTEEILPRALDGLSGLVRIAESVRHALCC